MGGCIATGELCAYLVRAFLTCCYVQCSLVATATHISQLLLLSRSVLLVATTVVNIHIAMCISHLLLGCVPCCNVVNWHDLDCEAGILLPANLFIKSKKALFLLLSIPDLPGLTKHLLLQNHWAHCKHAKQVHLLLRFLFTCRVTACKKIKHLNNKYGGGYR